MTESEVATFIANFQPKFIKGDVVINKANQQFILKTDSHLLTHTDPDSGQRTKMPVEIVKINGFMVNAHNLTKFTQL